MREGTVFENRRDENSARLWQRCVPFVVEQMREELAHIARRIEMSGDAPGAAADGECETIEIRHDREHRFRR